MNKILVIDLEATCDEGDGIPPEQMEIIEIGAVLADWNGIILDRFQTFVRPVENPRLTPFCLELTGIGQEDVDQAPSLDDALTLLDHFIQNEPGIWGSWGKYDARQFERETKRKSIANPLSAWRHINLKAEFAKKMKQLHGKSAKKQVGLSRALQMVGLTFEGCEHRGIDDAVNIARLLSWCK